MHLLGPNCLGFQRPHLNLNASAAGPLAAEGSLALVSQSGALTSAMLDWAQQNHVGFSQVVSLGPNAAVDLAQVLDFLATDTRTQSIVVYLEGISNPRRFMSALRSAAHAKPVVVLKAGRRSAGNEAALTHSRAIVGSDDVTLAGTPAFTFATKDVALGIAVSTSGYALAGAAKDDYALTQPTFTATIAVRPSAAPGAKPSPAEPAAPSVAPVVMRPSRTRRKISLPVYNERQQWQLTTTQTNIVIAIESQLSAHSFRLATKPVCSN